MIVNVDAAGNTTTFDSELLSVATAEYGDFSFGNVCHASLEQMAADPKFQRVATEIAAGVECCRHSCEYFGLCCAGSNKYWEHVSFDCSTTQHSRFRIQLVADVVVEGMERELGLSAAG